MKNTRFFHITSRSRERKKIIHGLNIDAEWLEEPKQIKSHVFEFFKRKFKKQQGRLPKLTMHRLKKLSMDEAISLERKMTEDEVWEAVKETDSQLVSLRSFGAS